MKILASDSTHHAKRRIKRPNSRGQEKGKAVMNFSSRAMVVGASILGSCLVGLGALKVYRSIDQ